MKILRIIARLNVGGPARHVVWLTEGLNDSEYTSTLVAGSVPAGEEDMSWFADEHGVRPVYLKEMSRELSPKDAVSLFKLFRIVRRERPDVVHTHTAKAGTVGRAAAFLYRWLTWRTLIGRPRKVKIVHTFHGHVFHSYYGGLKTRVFIFIEQMLARFATDRIVVITPQQFREIHEEVGIGRERQFSVVRLGIDLSSLEPDENARARTRGQFGTVEDELLIGFVGRLTAIKNLPMLINAAAAFFETPGGPRARFVIAGDGDKRAEIEGLAAASGVADRIVFAGNRTDIGAVYSGLDIVALTSLNEGTPLSLIEAMAAGKPVVSTAVGGVVDLLGEVREEIDGFRVCERGVSVDSGDHVSFAKALLYLAKNEKLRRDLSDNGRQFALSAYGKDRLLRDVKALYAELCER